jgi:predicted flap endonuclease-1-like 5' DNA nuclease
MVVSGYLTFDSIRQRDRTAALAGLRDNAPHTPASVRAPDPRHPPAPIPLPHQDATVSTVAVLVALTVALAIGYAAGRAHRLRNEGRTAMPLEPPPPATQPPVETPPASTPPPPVPASSAPQDGAIAERARIMRSLEAETAVLRRAIVSRDAALTQLADLAADRLSLHGDLAAARGETARYRQLVVDLENNAPPPFFGAGAPDDLKLIVGVGPMLERMLQQLGITTYRQIARWSDREIDEIDAKLPEFPGRIRRDAWVTQARELHQSKYGAPPSPRERG